MPEGDTVWRTARVLHDALSGRHLVRAELRVPRHATADLTGRTVREVASRGKHLLARIEPDLTLHTHLGMEGSWRVLPAGSRWPSPRAPVRAVLAVDEAIAVGRQLARVDLLRTADENTVVGHLGPDLLGPDWDADLAAQRLRADPDRPIGIAVLDQSALAGIGNIYRAELLFLRGVDPTTPVARVGDVHAMVDLAHRLLLANRERAAQVTTGDPRPDRRHWVYRRSGLPCRRCGTPIRRGELGEPGRERTTYWCPRCQPAG